MGVRNWPRSESGEWNGFLAFRRRQLSMQISQTMKFDADPTTVYDMLTDTDWLGAVAKRAEAQDHTATSQNDQTVLKLRIPTPDRVPTQVQRFIGDSMGLQVTQKWNPANEAGERTGTFLVTVDGFSAASASGNIALRKTPIGSEVVYTGDFNINIPIVGKKLESQAAPYVTRVFNYQEAAGKEWLKAN